MRIVSAILIIATLSILFFACKKETEDVTVGGKGGSSQLRIHPVYTSSVDPLDSCEIFIKNNTTDDPGEGNFDDSLVSNLVDGRQLAVFTQLRRGKYFIYARGFKNSLKYTGSQSWIIESDGREDDITMNLTR